MKILKEGKLEKGKTYIGECGHCKCLVEFKESEAKIYKGCINLVYIKCPSSGCNHLIYHKM